MMRLKACFCCLLAALFAGAAEPPFMVIRLSSQHHTDKALLQQTVDALTRYKSCCDEVWFRTESGLPPLARQQESAKLLVDAAAAVRAIGVEPGLQISSTIGHSDLIAADFSGLTWGTMVGADGVKAKRSSCPRQPDFLKYLHDMAAAFAACKPSSVWLDDDLRLSNHAPVAAGCYCETCLAAFNQQVGGAFTRETLVAALAKGEGAVALRKKWIVFGQESLAGVARAVAKGVHEVSPQTRMGFQHCGPGALVNGPDWTPVFKALKDESGLPVGSRPGAGFYTDYAPRGMIEKAFDLARQIGRLPECVDRIAPEIENFRHCATGKTAHGMAVESMLYLAMGGNGLTYEIMGCQQEPVAWYASTYMSELSVWRPFYEEYVRFNRGTKPGGIQPFFSRGHAFRTLGERENPLAWTRANPDRSVAGLAAIGLPMCPDSEWPVCFMADAEAVDGMTDVDIQRVLSSGSILDGGAVAHLQARGYGAAMGLTAAPRPLDVFEVFTDDEMNKNMVGHTWKLWFSDAGVYGLTPSNEAARVIGRYQRVDGTAAEAVSVLTETAAGGRIAAFGFAGFTSEVSAARRRQLLLAADWVARGRLPVFVETVSQAVVVPRVMIAGDLRSVTVLNATIDVQQPITLRLRGCKEGLETMEWVTPKEKPVTVSVRWEGKDVIAVLPALGPWQIGWLRPTVTD
jgi:hypothetical protein